MLDGLALLEERMARAAGLRPAKCSGYRQPTAKEVSEDVRFALKEFERRHGLEGQPSGGPSA